MDVVELAGARSVTSAEQPVRRLTARWSDPALLWQRLVMVAARRTAPSRLDVLRE